MRLLVTAAVLAVAAAGCGGSRSSDSTPSGLLTLGDIPLHAVAGKTLGSENPCSPVPILHRANGIVRRTPSFKFGRYYAQETVAVFPNMSSEEGQFAALVSKQRQRCMWANSSFIGRPTSLTTHAVLLGDQAKAFFLRIERRPSQGSVEFEIFSVREGRAVATLLLAADPAPLPRNLGEQITGAATHRLALTRES